MGLMAIKRDMDLIERDSNHPLCPLCNAGMPLVHTRLSAGADLHRFECRPCGVEFTELAQVPFAQSRSTLIRDDLNEAF